MVLWLVRALARWGLKIHAPKQRRAMLTVSRGYTDWTVVDVIDDLDVCFASLTYEYYTATSSLPSEDDAFFLSEAPSAAHSGLFWGLSSDHLANVMRDAMIAAGVPGDFLPHSAHHAGMAYWRGMGEAEDDVMQRANMTARTYVMHYRQTICSNAASS